MIRIFFGSISAIAYGRMPEVYRGKLRMNAPASIPIMEFGQLETEAAALTGGALHSQASSLAIRKLSTNEQSQAQAPARIVAMRALLVEPFEYARQVIRADTATGVMD